MSEEMKTEAPEADAATEAKAILSMVEALNGLDRAAVARVLDWAAKRYGARIAEAASRSAKDRPAPASNNPPEANDQTYRDLAELYSAANPQTEAEKVLVAAYWHQVHEENDNLDSQALNTALKNLGHGVSNVTRSCSALMSVKPALMLQVKKAGSTKQARKLYRVTTAGVQRVREMLAGKKADVDEG